MSQRSFFASSVVPFRLVFLMWLTFTIEVYTSTDLSFLGIMPRSWPGLVGILTAPLIHGNLVHLVSNTFPLIFLGSILFYFYPRIGGIVFFRCYFITNLLVWILSPRPSYHIGASGIIYGLSAFLIFFGLLRRDFLSLLISIVVILIYGGIFFGVLPTDPRISWESHLAGAMVGIISAFELSSKKKVS